MNVWKSTLYKTYLKNISLGKICSEICPRSLSVTRSEKKTVGLEEQIMPMGKYMSIFSGKTKATSCVYCPSNIFRNIKSYSPGLAGNNYVT